MCSPSLMIDDLSNIIAGGLDRVSGSTGALQGFAPCKGGVLLGVWNTICGHRNSPSIFQFSFLFCCWIIRSCMAHFCGKIIACLLSRCVISLLTIICSAKTNRRSVIIHCAKYNAHQAVFISVSSSFFPRPSFCKSASISAGLYIFAFGCFVSGSSVSTANSTAK